MEQLKKIEDFLESARRNASLYYIGIFFKDKELISKTSSRSKYLAVNLGRLINRSSELNQVLPNFKREFLFSEGKDYSLFVYYLDENISIGMIHLGRPNFSLLKVTALELSSQLINYLPLLTDFYNQKYLTSIDNSVQQEPQQEEENVEDKIIFSVNYPEHFQIENIETKSEYLEDKFDTDVPSLNDILMENNHDGSEAKKEIEQESSRIVEKSENVLSTDELDRVLSNIKTEFVRAIGPFGSFLFNKKKEKFLNNDFYTKYDILKFINILSEDISVSQRKRVFLENAKSYLINI